jgi:superfamily II DNA/RNA helicase
VLGRIAHKTSIKLQLGESGSTITGGHILVTAPGFLKSKLTARGKPDIDLSALKMIVYDEADELFI